MEHVVFFTGPDGSAQFRRVPSLDEAVRHVESLRNGEGVDDSVVFAMTEVPLRFQTYYRVELPGEASAAPAAEPTPAVEESPAAEPAPATDSVAERVAESALSESAHLEPVAETPVADAAIPESAVPVAVASESAPAPDAEVTLAPEMPTIEAITPAPVLPEAVPAVPAGEVAEPSANGKPNRGMGFFAR